MSLITLYPLPRQIEREHRYYGISYTENSIKESIDSIGVIFENLYKSYFPKNYFKDTYKNTMAILKTHLRRNYEQYKRPYLCIGYGEIEIDSNNPINLLENSKGIYDMSNIVSNKKLFDLGYYGDVGLHFNINRYQISINVIIEVESYDEGYSRANVLKNILQRGDGLFNIISRDIRFKIPTLYLKHIAIKTDHDYLSDEFLALLNDNSCYPIERVIHPNNVAEFFYIYTAVLQLDLNNDIAFNQYNRNNMVGGKYVIGDSIKVSATLPSVMVVSDTSEIKNIHLDFRYEDIFRNENVTPFTIDSELVPLLEINTPEIIRSVDNFTEIMSFDITFENTVESVAVDDLMAEHNDLYLLIEKMVNSGIVSNTIFKVIITNSETEDDYIIDTLEKILEDLTINIIYKVKVFIDFSIVNEYYKTTIMDPSDRIY